MAVDAGSGPPGAAPATRRELPTLELALVLAAAVLLRPAMAGVFA